MAMAQQGLHAYISGRVQGVFYRAHTIETAKALGLTGWVRNLPDGRVEVKAFGESMLLDKFKQWLHQGPINAKVDKVESKEIPWQVHQTFKMEPTPS